MVDPNLDNKQHELTNVPKLEVDVTVSTASVIITHPENPYRILVAHNAKHNKPVIIGGKVEVAGYGLLESVVDPDSILSEDERLALATAYQEAWEEAVADDKKAKDVTGILSQMQGMWTQAPRYIGKANDPNRDVRTVPFKKVKAALIEPPRGNFDPENKLTDDTLVTARYGTPDSIYIGTMNPDLLGSTEEMGDFHYIDIRELSLGGLGAGHDVIVLRYREMLEKGDTTIPDSSMVDFDQARKELI